MARMALGLRQKALNRPLRSSLPVAGKLGAAGLELTLVGDLTPRELSQTARRDIRHLFDAHQLVISALELPLRFGLDEPENQDARIEHVQEAMTLSFDLGCRIVTIACGSLPEETNPRSKTFDESLVALGQFGDRTGTTLVLETGLASAEDLNGWLTKYDTAGLGAALNPGLSLVHGHDPYAAARTVRSRLRVVHAGDARRGLTPRLVPVGRGDVDWLEMMATLAEIDYTGFLTVASEPGLSAESDAAAGLAFLRRLVR